MQTLFFVKEFIINEPTDFIFIAKKMTKIVFHLYFI